MPKYKVYITGQLNTLKTVEAKNETEAREKALDLISSLTFDIEVEEIEE